MGKTCLAKMFVERQVLEQSCNTIGFDHHVREIEVEEGIHVKVSMQEREWKKSRKGRVEQAFVKK